MGLGNCFKGRQFTAEAILWAVRWYLMFPVSYRDLELMLLDRGVEVDHTTIFRWIQAYATELEKRIRPHLRMSNGSWRVDETYIRVKGRWTYLYRAVDSRGQTIDFLLAARRDTAAAKRFFRKAIAQPHVANPRTLTVDKNPAYPRAVADMKSDGQRHSSTASSLLAGWQLKLIRTRRLSWRPFRARLSLNARRAPLRRRLLPSDQPRLWCMDTLTPSREVIVLEVR